MSSRNPPNGSGPDRPGDDEGADRPGSGDGADRFGNRSADPAGSSPILVAKSYQNLRSADETAGKFVLLLQDRTLHLVLSPVDFTPYHANIVWQYLQAEGRGRVEEAGEGGCRIVSRDWSVRGGGYYQSQNWLHHLRLHGKSTAFGKYHEPLLAPHLDDIPAVLGLEGYTVTLE